MVKKIIITTSLIFLALAGGVLYATAAISPSLSLAYQSNDTVAVSVYADPNAAVKLYYANQNSSLGYIATIGDTNYNGYFSILVSSAYYNIPTGAALYVVVNGLPSNDASWPGYADKTATSSQVSFSQNNISLATGQTTAVTIYGSYSDSYYISSTASPVASAIVTSNILTVYGLSSGTADINVCSYSGSYCGTLTVTVNGYADTYGQYSSVSQDPTAISLSQTTISLNIGQNRTVNIYGSGSYYLTNANSSVASASVSGDILTVYGNNAGVASIGVCQNNNSCTALYVDVTANGYNYTQSSCVPNSYEKCSGNTVYWFDSCGSKESLVQSCPSNQICSEAACVAAAPTVPTTPTALLSMVKTVRNLSSGNLSWSASVAASPGDIVQFQISLLSLSSAPVNNLTVSETLPPNLSYDKSLTLDNATASGNPITGLSLGSLLAGQTRVITYQAQVAPAASFSFGSTTLTASTNITSTDAGFAGPAASSAWVVVTRTGLLGASTVSTGLTNNFFVDSFFLPLLLALVGVWLVRKNVLGINNWSLAQKISGNSNASQKVLQSRIEQVKQKENLP